jgi:hypothetical protein
MQLDGQEAWVKMVGFGAGWHIFNTGKNFPFDPTFDLTFLRTA